MSARTCADCTLCCKVMAIEELEKPAGRWCQHCRPGRGCLIYADRPAECRAFSCLWLLDERFGPHWRPSQSKMVLTTSADGIQIRCDPGFPDAWRKQPFHSEIGRLAASGEMHDVTVLVIASSISAWSPRISASCVKWKAPGSSVRRWWTAPRLMERERITGVSAWPERFARSRPAAGASGQRDPGF
jgi:hypothetical protein